MILLILYHHRELLGELSRAASEAVKELLAAAVVEEEGFRPGVVSVVQTFGDRANFHPHVHALATRGGWTASGEWVPVPYVDERAAEELVARVLVQIPDPRRHLARYYGAYSNRARGQRRKAEAELEGKPSSETSDDTVPKPAERAALRRRSGESHPTSLRGGPLVCCRACGGGQECA